MVAPMTGGVAATALTMLSANSACIIAGAVVARALRVMAAALGHAIVAALHIACAFRFAGVSTTSV